MKYKTLRLNSLSWWGSLSASEQRGYSSNPRMIKVEEIQSYYGTKDNSGNDLNRNTLCTNTRDS